MGEVQGENRLSSMKTMSSCQHGVYTISLPDSLHPALQAAAVSTASTSKHSAEPKQNGDHAVPELTPAPESCPESMDSCRKFHWRWFLDILMGGSVSAGLIMMEYGIIPTVQTGFYCDDPKISYKFRGDTISITVLLSFTLLVPFIGLWVIESCCYSTNGYEVIKSVKHRSLTGARQALYWYWEFFVGLVMVLVVTEVAKSLVGEPRPHFLDTCRPDLVSNCTKASNYISSNYKCTNTDISQWLIRDSNKSFPSGHASMSTYTAVFMMWFIQHRVSKNATFLLVPWLQCLCLMWAMICSFTRITDHRHHWWDVLAGFLIGAIMAIFTVKYFCGDFFSYHSQAAMQTSKVDGSLRENGHIGTSNGGNRHLSVRHLLSSTSSYTSSITPEERELREVATT